MLTKKIKTVANQRIIKIKKEATDNQHKYTTNNLNALDEALKQLTSTGGFKLYMYLAKNQNNYELALSSADVNKCCGLAYTAYRTAFEELVDKGYLVPVNQKQTLFIFRDKANSSIEIKDKAFGSIEQEQEQDKKIEFKKSDNGFVF